MEFEIESKLIDKCICYEHNLQKIPVINEEITYTDFFENYMHINIPCVLKNITKTWEANFKWLNKEKQPDLLKLKQLYGSCEVCVYNCKERYYNSQKTECYEFGKYLDCDWSDISSLKYLKDWHLKNVYKDDNFYEVPIYFASDWLNEYLVDNCEDDYRFVYMGQAGTWTPFHADVFSSYSWSANVCGSKRWILFPPGEENLMKDELNNLPYDVSEIYQSMRYFELVQNPGEAIFVPSGWHHQVWNLEDTISVNHNWINGCNINYMWLSIQKNLDGVKKEIEDCQDMEDFLGHCQLMLNASYGMNFYKFYNFLEYIGIKRLNFLQNGINKVLFHGHTIGTNHALFDLKAVKTVLEGFVKHEDVTELFITSSQNPTLFLDTLINFLDKKI